MAQTSDVVIIGGGVIGGSIAWSLARRGVTVTVVEAGRIGRGASWASAGVLAPEWSAHDPPALTTLAEDSLACWADWAAELEEQTGTGLNFRRDGLLNVWVDPDAPHLPPDLAVVCPPERRSERLSAAEVRKLEPMLTGPIAGGILYHEDAQVDNPRLAPALIRAASDLGARVLTDSPVATLARQGGPLHGRPHGERARDLGGCGDCCGRCMVGPSGISLGRNVAGRALAWADARLRRADSPLSAHRLLRRAGARRPPSRPLGGRDDVREGRL